MDFIAMDFETAASRRDSICAVGLTLVIGDSIVDCLSFLINPERPFNRRNTAIHGISKCDIENAPLFPEVWGTIKHYFHRYPVVAHNAIFEKGALEATAHRYNLPLPIILYYDTLAMLRWNYPYMSSYTLDAVCDTLGIELSRHHECGADSAAAAALMIHMLQNDEHDIFPLVIGDRREAREIISEPIDPPAHYSPVNLPDYAEAAVEYDIIVNFQPSEARFVVTGELIGYSRESIYEIIKARGGIIANSVTKSTQYVLVGKQDKNAVTDAQNAKSRKIIAAEALRQSGYDIKIMRLEDFIKLCD